MKVKDLIRQLNDFMDDDLEVLVEHPSHDYWRTQLAGVIRGVEEATVEWSEYHREYALPRDPDKSEDDMERPKRVVLLK